MTSIRRGDIVIVKKGANVRSLHPQKREYVTVRAQRVRVSLVTGGYEYEGAIVPAEVSWAGSGGYWCYARLSDVEQITA